MARKAVRKAPKTIELADELGYTYREYARYTLLDRAIADVRDGFKPVHRRIVYAMDDMGLGPTAQHRKSARVVGEVLGKYHPHGDQSVYDALARMAQDFSLREVLIDGQGNFGSIDGDSPQGRGGKGIQSLKITKATGPVVAAAAARMTRTTKVDVLAENGKRQRVPLKSIPRARSRQSRGKKLVTIGPVSEVVLL